MMKFKEYVMQTGKFPTYHLFNLLPEEKELNLDKPSSRVFTSSTFNIILSSKPFSFTISLVFSIPLVEKKQLLL